MQPNQPPFTSAAQPVSFLTQNVEQLDTAQKAFVLECLGKARESGKIQCVALEAAALAETIYHNAPCDSIRIGAAAEAALCYSMVASTPTIKALIEQLCIEAYKASSFLSDGQVRAIVNLRADIEEPMAHKLGRQPRKLKMALNAFKSFADTPSHPLAEV